jgi:hypothetical protein
MTGFVIRGRRSSVCEGWRHSQCCRNELESVELGSQRLAFLQLLGVLQSLSAYLSLEFAIGKFGVIKFSSQLRFDGFSDFAGFGMSEMIHENSPQQRSTECQSRSLLVSLNL